MTESMRIDVRQTVPLGEFLHPACHAVGVHGLTVILAEHKTVVNVVVAELQPLLCLVALPLPEKLHSLNWQTDPADRSLGLGCVLIDSTVGAVQDRVFNVNAIILVVNC